jgi:hypothetical protein
MGRLGLNRARIGIFPARDIIDHHSINGINRVGQITEVQPHHRSCWAECVSTKTLSEADHLRRPIGRLSAKNTYK